MLPLKDTWKGYTALLLVLSLVAGTLFYYCGDFKTRCEDRKGHVYALSRTVLCLSPDNRIIEL